jgi:hypothetical protein
VLNWLDPPYTFSVIRRSGMTEAGFSPCEKSDTNLTCYGTVCSSILALQARLAFLASAGTPLLDYKRGVPVARPRVEAGNII